MPARRLFCAAVTPAGGARLACSDGMTAHPPPRLDPPPAPLDPDLDPAPLDRARLRAAAPGRLDVRVVDEVDSTNAELVAAARAGAGDGTVLVAERQRAGRGRLGRRWESAPGAGLTLSWLVRPGPAGVRALGWLPLAAGVAVVRAVRSRAGVPAVLKWPNDVVVEGSRGGKLAGVLVEVVPGSARPPAAVVGIGLNVSAGPAGLPAGAAGIAALRPAGAAPLDRTALAVALLGELTEVRARWEADPASIGDEYRGLCATLGRAVRVLLPGGGAVEGTAGAVDGDGRLVVDGTPFSAADVVHLRPSREDGRGPEDR
jgi:BirA family biotin operon repressor/biotin-[acetyl-CoA-carboxylase] ligase